MFEEAATVCQQVLTYTTVEKKASCCWGTGDLSLLNLVAHSPPLPWMLTREEGMDKELKASQSHGDVYQVTAPLVLAALEALAAVGAQTLWVNSVKNVTVGTVR